MSKRIIIIICAVIFGVVGLYNIGEGERALKNALRYQGYTKCGDGIYRCREINETESGLVIVDRTFDIKANRGESHITVLFERLDGKLVKDTEVVNLSEWSFEEHCFIPIT